MSIMYIASLIIIWAYLRKVIHYVIWICIPIACMHELVIIYTHNKFWDITLYCINVACLSTGVFRIYQHAWALLHWSIIFGMQLSIAIGINELYLPDSMSILPLSYLLLVLLIQQIRQPYLLYNWEEHLALNFSFLIAVNNLLYIIYLTFVSLNAYDSYVLAVYILLNLIIIILIIILLFIHLFNHKKS